MGMQLAMANLNTTLTTFCSTSLPFSYYYMGSIYIIKPLSTVVSGSVNQSQQHEEKNSWKTPSIAPEAAGCKARTLPLVLCTIPLSSSYFLISTWMVSIDAALSIARLVWCQ